MTSNLRSCEITIITSRMVFGIRIVLSNIGISFKGINLTAWNLEKPKCEFSVLEGLRLGAKVWGRYNQKSPESTVCCCYLQCILTGLSTNCSVLFCVYLAENICNHFWYRFDPACTMWFTNTYTQGEMRPITIDLSHRHSSHSHQKQFRIWN